MGTKGGFIKNFIQDGDFRSVTPGSFDVTASAAIGLFWSSAGTSTNGPVTRGTFATSVAAFSGVGNDVLNESVLQSYLQFSISNPVVLNAGSYFASITASIPNGNRTFSGKYVRLAFWINSTSRLIGVRMRRNFGTGSATAEQITDRLVGISPGIWQQVVLDLSIPTLTATDDLRSSDFLSFGIVLDNVASLTTFSYPVRFVETSSSPTPTVKISGVSCELLSQSGASSSDYEPAVLSDVSQLTDKKGLLGASGIPADGSVTAPKIAPQAVTLGKINSNAVTGVNIQAGTITADKISQIYFSGSVATTAGSILVTNGVITGFTPT